MRHGSKACQNLWVGSLPALRVNDKYYFFQRVHEIRQKSLYLQNMLTETMGVWLRSIAIWRTRGRQSPPWVTETTRLHPWLEDRCERVWGFFCCGFCCCCFFSQFLRLLSICNSGTLAAGRKRSAPRYELSRYISRRLSVKLLMVFCGATRLSRSSQFISRHPLYLSRTLHFVMFH